MGDPDYSVEILPSAQRELAKLAPPTRQRVARAIDRLAREPRPRGARLLSGSADRPIWRLRVGTYRVLYEIRDDRLVALVIRVAHRRGRPPASRRASGRTGGPIERPHR